MRNHKGQRYSYQMCTGTKCPQGFQEGTKIFISTLAEIMESHFFNMEIEIKITLKDQK